MKLLLTSGGIKNPSIEAALIDLLVKPISECKALCIPTAIYPYRGGQIGAYRFIAGTSQSPMTNLGWKSLGVLELTALPSIEEEAWVPVVEEADALLVFGGNVLYLSRWMRESGLGELLRSGRFGGVYVGISAGAMVASSTIGETVTGPKTPTGDGLTVETSTIKTADGEMAVHFTVASGIGLVDSALLPHVDNPSFPENSMANCEIWTTKLPVPFYAIDDDTAIKVVDGKVEVVSEGNWRLFNG